MRGDCEVICPASQIRAPRAVYGVGIAITYQTLISFIILDLGRLVLDLQVAASAEAALVQVFKSQVVLVPFCGANWNEIMAF